MFTAENLMGVAEGYTSAIPDEAWDAELQKWAPEGRISQDEVGAEQIAEWIDAKLILLDEYFACVGE